MPECCNPSGYEKTFGEKEASRTLRVYDRKGLNKIAQQVVDFLKLQGVDGDRILEVGGGIGAVHVELLKAGAASAINVELSPGYQEVATELLRREGLEGRVELRIGDFTEIAKVMEADHVIMNRVICCYPYMEKLMHSGLTASRRFFAATFPRDRLASRMVVRLENAYHRARGVEFRSYIHSPKAILETARRAGFDIAFEDRDLIWHGVVFERTA